MIYCAIFNNANTRCALASKAEGREWRFTPFMGTRELDEYCRDNGIEVKTGQCFAGFSKFKEWLKSGGVATAGMLG